MIQSIATAYFQVTTLPQSDRARDFASADSLAELFREDHCLVPRKKFGIYSALAPA